ncbi:MAG TPA: type III effector HopAG1 [Rhodopseudomonas sp.]|uniref:type III effector HopAG1 n=1 Tax=Rhodopseudomonas sp. TaxID=1078 RepID=UPI002ED8573F
MPAASDQIEVLEASGWRKVGSQAGSNPGGVFADGDGVRWYVKTPATADHARNEVLANRLYRLAGVKVPDVELARRDGELAVASRMVKGLTLAELPEHLAKQAGAGVGEGFAADAWLANRDALGVDLDNMIVTGAGELIRIDQGGALRYRAQGSLKAEFGPLVVEFDTLRDRRKNAVAASFFAAMTQQQVLASLRRVTSIGSAAIIAAVQAIYGDSAESSQLINILIARRDDLAERAARLGAD